MPEFTPINKVENEEAMKLEDISDAENDGGPVKDIKDEPVDEDGAVNDNAENENGEKKTKANGKVKTPATPRKRGRKAAGEKTNDENGNEDESPTKKQKTPKGGKGGAAGDKAKAGVRPIPTSYENAGPEDRMLLRMKDDENKPWTEIRQAWEEITGEKIGGSTLSGRYARIKANFVVFKEDDEQRLLRFKKEIEEGFENEKWRRVAEAIEGDGGGKYPPAALLKKFKELSKKVSNMAIGQENDGEA
ncbi:hypothetical protein AJ79_08308 [Helicocarpus griseus UAMH5409]|uniref:Myb-like domain-containing protein n=1 Tax=Helicocarpus griseus UAMH5409 TaxID=1447875 RepID=A0A2B7WTW9_9EURO|nr:hypothetical protein AJ79_08308 [Helicocarpus griseus UAMH5409]